MNQQKSSLFGTNLRTSLLGTKFWSTPTELDMETLTRSKELDQEYQRVLREYNNARLLYYNALQIATHRVRNTFNQ
ncbi:hypothetical protein ACX27_28665 [Nostoc piscinale CENA21]|uniref:Uncharacterized protein n=1 Tax=Nostoc piscinale CENA21 TaxID=224013 RepID=A0A0M4TYE5_9NOSO|nr:hypothetical protein [Nostoc piscinale]ALF55919.1 hypothetical protein ACX27_28665 [Nostoc piscinale CENA21]